MDTKVKLDYDGCAAILNWLSVQVSREVENSDFEMKLVLLTLFDLKCKIERKLIGVRRDRYNFRIKTAEALAILCVCDDMPEIETHQGIVIMNLYNTLHRANY